MASIPPRMTSVTELRLTECLRSSTAFMAPSAKSDEYLQLSGRYFADNLPENLSGIGVVLALCAGMIGTGIAAMPMAFRLTHFYLGTFLNLSAGFMAFVGILALTIATQRSRVASFEALGEAIFGRTILRYILCEGAVVVALLLAGAIYIVIASSIISSTIGGSEGFQQVGFKIFVAAVITAFSLIRTYDHLKYTTAYCLFAYITSAVLIVLSCASRPTVEGAEKDDITLKTILAAWGQMTLGYMCHFNVPGLYAETQRPAKPTAWVYAAVAVGITIVVYGSGVIPYSVFLNQTQGNILYQLTIEDSQSIALKAAQFLLGSTTVLSTPLYFFPLKTLVLGFMGKNITSCSVFENVASTSFVVSCAALVAITASAIEVLCQIGGATAGLTCMAIAPGLFLYKKATSNLEKSVGAALFVYGVVVMCLCLFSIFTG